MASFHQAVAQGARAVGLAGAGQPEGQHGMIAALHEAALGQTWPSVLPQRQGDSVVLDRFPRSCPRAAGSGSRAACQRDYRGWRRSSAGPAPVPPGLSPCPATVKRASGDWAPTAWALNWPHLARLVSRAHPRSRPGCLSRRSDFPDRVQRSYLGLGQVPAPPRTPNNLQPR